MKLKVGIWFSILCSIDGKHDPRVQSFGQRPLVNVIRVVCFSLLSPGNIFADLRITNKQVPKNQPSSIRSYFSFSSSSSSYSSSSSFSCSSSCLLLLLLFLHLLKIYFCFRSLSLSIYSCIACSPRNGAGLFPASKEPEARVEEPNKKQDTWKTRYGNKRLQANIVLDKRNANALELGELTSSEIIRAGKP